MLLLPPRIKIPPRPRATSQSSHHFACAPSLLSGHSWRRTAVKGAVTRFTAVAGTSSTLLHLRPAVFLTARRRREPAGVTLEVSPAARRSSGRFEIAASHSKNHPSFFSINRLPPNLRPQRMLMVEDEQRAPGACGNLASHEQPVRPCPACDEFEPRPNKPARPAEYPSRAQ
jgi:hypothetical protein